MNTLPARSAPHALIAARGGPRPVRLRLLALAAATALGLAQAPARALDFDTVALSGSTVLPLASGATTHYLFGLRTPTLADDGWVGFAPGDVNAIAGFMIGVPGEVRRVVSSGETLGGSALGVLRQLRVDSGQNVSLTLGLSPGAATYLHYTGTADGSGATALAKVPSANTTAIYNKPGGGGTIGFELLPGGQQLVHAFSASGTFFEAGRLAADSAHSVLVRTGTTATRILDLPALGAPGVGTPAAGRSWANVQAVGGDASGRSFLFGQQAGIAPTIDGAQLKSNLVEVRPDGVQVAIVFPGSSVPGVARPFQGIHSGLAQFASNAQGSLAFRGEFGRNTTDERKLSGALLRYDAGATAAESRLRAVALPGDTVPGLVSGGGTAVTFGHKLVPDSGASLSPLAMLPDNLVTDSARGLAINDAGAIAFVSAVTALPAAAGYGVFLSQADGSFATLATTGTIAGGLAPDADASFAKFHDVTINNSGLVVFSATLAGAAGRQGLWYGHGAADLHALVVEGQTIEVLPGVFKTVGDLSTDLHELADTRITALDDGLNNAGQFAFSVRFTDGSEAVLRTALVSSVPEPGAWWLMAGGLVWLGGRARRRAATA